MGIPFGALEYDRLLAQELQPIAVNVIGDFTDPNMIYCTTPLNGFNFRMHDQK